MIEPTMREALSKAFDESAAKDADAAPPMAAEPVQQVEAAAPEQETETQRAERNRDEAGRFARAAKDAAAKKPDAVAILAQPIGTEPAATEAPKVEVARVAPQSLTPAEREAFAKAPPELQTAIVRRERQHEVAMQDASRSKQFASEFQRVVEPYMGLIRAGTGDPLKTIGGLLQTAHVLQTASAQQKAALVAEIVRMYSVDITSLDTELAGQASGAGATQGTTFDREALQRETAQRVVMWIEERDRKSETARVNKDLATFAGTHEFFDDVRDTMGRLMQAELATDLESAYKDACARDPEISRVLAQREASKQAATGVQATQRARAAASSVKSSPATPMSGSGAGADRRAQLEAAMNAAEGR